MNCKDPREDPWVDLGGTELQGSSRGSLRGSWWNLTARILARILKSILAELNNKDPHAPYCVPRILAIILTDMMTRIPYGILAVLNQKDPHSTNSRGSVQGYSLLTSKNFFFQKKFVWWLLWLGALHFEFWKLKWNQRVISSYLCWRLGISEKHQTPQRSYKLYIAPIVACFILRTSLDLDSGAVEIRLH